MVERMDETGECTIGGSYMIPLHEIPDRWGRCTILGDRFGSSRTRQVSPSSFGGRLA